MDVSDASYAAYIYWLDKKTWTPEQAAFLLGGLDPESFVEWSSYPSHKEQRQYESYSSMCRLISAAKRSKELKAGRLSPPEWLAWAGAKKLKVSLALNEAIAAKWTSKAPTPKPGSKSLSDELSTKERVTLLVIAAALAKLAKVDLSQPSKAALVIESASEELGARVGRRTIEEHLKQIPAAIERKGR